VPAVDLEVPAKLNDTKIKKGKTEKINKKEKSQASKPKPKKLLIVESDEDEE
jgi:hypothetical protein